MSTYTGRLACDGAGTLFADESRAVGSRTIVVHDENGEEVVVDGVPVEITVPTFRFGKNHGKPVAYEDGKYVFVGDGEPSHNDRHHEQFAGMSGTVDEDQVRQAEIESGVPEGTFDYLINVRDGENQHHYAAVEGDPHYVEGATDRRGRLTNTVAKTDPDSVAATITGHTEAYSD